MICENCGKEISDKSKFCGYCGAKTVEQLVQSQPQAVKESIFSRFHFCKFDLITLWKVVENPFQGSELSFSASVVIVVLNLIANILILRCIICGIGLTIVFVGSIYTYYYLNRREGKKNRGCILWRSENYICSNSIYITHGNIYFIPNVCSTMGMGNTSIDVILCGFSFCDSQKRESFLNIRLESSSIQFHC